MDGERRAELERIMAALAAGDRAMVLALHVAFAGEIRAALVAHARDCGLDPLRPDELDDLALDVCFILEPLAPAWRPDGGALPWVWAKHRLRNLIHAHVGQRCDELPPDGGADTEAPPPAPATTRPSVVVLDELAGRRPDVALVREALRLVVPAADVPLLLAHAEQVADGDPSPSITVASMVGRSPAAVRKAVQRNRQRLADLARTDAGFRPLLDLALLGPAGTVGAAAVAETARAAGAAAA